MKVRRGKQFHYHHFPYQIVTFEKDKNFHLTLQVFSHSLVRHGNLDSVRTYNHIDDLSSCILGCKIDKCKYGETYNIGIILVLLVTFGYVNK